MKRTIFLNDFSSYYPVGTKVYFLNYRTKKMSLL